MYYKKNIYYDNINEFIRRNDYYNSKKKYKSS